MAKIQDKIGAEQHFRPGQHPLKHIAQRISKCRLIRGAEFRIRPLDQIVLLIQWDEIVIDPKFTQQMERIMVPGRKDMVAVLDVALFGRTVVRSRFATHPVTRFQNQHIEVAFEELFCNRHTCQATTNNDCALLRHQAPLR